LRRRHQIQSLIEEGLFSLDPIRSDHRS
jgi:hypothetical protein